MYYKTLILQPSNNIYKVRNQKSSMSWTVTIIIVVILLFFFGFRIVRPIERGVIERFGKNVRIATPGLSWIVPFIEKMIRVNITERMVDVEPQTVITKDKLNAIVDAVVYFQIKDIQASLYNVDNIQDQLTSLARTTLRSVIGKMSLTEANENRDEINMKVEGILDKETKSYGVEVLRVEIQKIEPPQDVQEAMNKVVKAEQEKIASNDLATAKEIEADGARRAEIKKAEGIKRGLILNAEGEAESMIKVANAKAKEIALVNDALNKHFKAQAQVYKKLEVTQESLRNGTKYVIDPKSNITNVMTEMSGVVPIPKDKKK
ncbi:MAG: regulator of protease activity HflC (stomatin/prohibitin superfamily) [Candidatus Woesearchaeota archaeon]|jgi:regulator of protease activity HflC (stomatin/prohibitin superfamily)